MSTPAKAWYEFRMLNWGIAGGSNPKRNPPADGDRVGDAFMLADGPSTQLTLVSPLPLQSSLLVRRPSLPPSLLLPLSPPAEFVRPPAFPFPDRFIPGRSQVIHVLYRVIHEERRQWAIKLRDFV